MFLSLGKLPNEENYLHQKYSCNTSKNGNSTHFRYNWIIIQVRRVSRYWGKLANQIVYFSCDLSTKNYYALSTNSHFPREKADIDLFWILIFVTDFFKNSTETNFMKNNFAEDYCLQVMLWQGSVSSPCLNNMDDRRPDITWKWQLESR